MQAQAAREMLPAERRARIVAALEDQQAVRVPALSEDLGVSEITIRRDLLLLEREGVLERTYGGAVDPKADAGRAALGGGLRRPAVAEVRHRQGCRRR